MRTERRCVQRKRPGGISYFEFEAGSGGIILDASEKGLGFQAADAVRQLGPNRIWISPHPEERIELTGDVVWTDASKKTGGLRFVETGASSSKKIRNWLGSQESETLLSEEFPLPAWATQVLGDLRPEALHDESSRSPAKARVKAEVDEQRQVELHPIPSVPSLFTSSLPWQPEDSSSSGRRIGYRVATGFLIIVLVAAGMILFDMYRPEVGAFLVHLGEKINGSTRVRPQNPSPLPSPAQALAQPSAAKEAKPEAVQSDARANAPRKDVPGDFAAPPDSLTRVNSRSAGAEMQRAAQTTKEVPQRAPFRPGASGAQDRSAEATRLWSAVASGDSSAEVGLAQLYLKGEGVPRNCEQAKVLLRAAAKGGSSEARQQLKKLGTRGCRSFP